MSVPTRQGVLFYEAMADAEASRGGKPRSHTPHSNGEAVGLRLCVLGSGSGGNSTALRSGRHCMLIDAGFGPRTTQRRLNQAGLDLDAVSAICLTHLDADHFRRTWGKSLRDREITLWVHRWHLSDLRRVTGGTELINAGRVRTFDRAPFEPIPGVRATGVRLQHDLQGTIGYRFDAGRTAVGYATDLGHVPDRLLDLLAGVDLLCLESNYDERMTLTSSRPTFVNRRNMSDSGHLSNEQAFAAVQQIDWRSPPGLPRRVVLLHRSSQCNHPTKVRRVFERDPGLAARVVQTEQRRRTRWLTAKPQPVQVRMQLRWPF